MNPALRSSEADALPLVDRIRSLSAAHWGEERATVLVGRAPALHEALEKVLRFARSDSPVLITGETGTGKELFARATYLLSNRTRKPFLRVNCAQYTSEQLVVSELFGHRKGSFTGAVGDHRGIFEEADGGCVFLDEIAELPPAAQAILLRLIGEGEILPVGGVHPRQVDVRILAATSADLASRVAAGAFRADLYFRLRFLHVHVPPVRERDDDWFLIAAFYLDRLCRKHGTTKALSDDTLDRLSRHAWPGNVREVRSCIETGYHMSLGTSIAPRDLIEALEVGARVEQLRKVPIASASAELGARLASGQEDFWDAVHRPFMERDLNRTEVRAIIAEGLKLAGGSYKRLLPMFGIREEDYLKFMDFLRHHDLKPEAWRATRPTHWRAPAGPPQPLPLEPAISR